MRPLRTFCTALFVHQIAWAASDPMEQYRQRQANASPATVVAWLQAGNQRFAAGGSIHGGYGVDARPRVVAAAPSQRPLAAVLSCIDSRTAPEVVFDTTVGDLFTIRVGGNVISHDILGSLEVSVASGAKVVVVLGHADCGAVKGACRDVEFEHLTAILEKVKPAISSTNHQLDDDPEMSDQVGERVVSNPKYVHAIAHTNARQSLQQILVRSSYIKRRVESQDVVLVSALYDIKTGRVEFDL